MINIPDNIKCTKCGTAMLFHLWRGLSMIMRCPECGRTAITPNPRWGLEEDLDRF